MADRPERVLAIDIDTDVVRGIVLANGEVAVAGGYAQLGFDHDQGPAAVAARIAAALDVKAVLPVVVTSIDSLGEDSIANVLAAIGDGGFSAVSQTSRRDAERRANPDGGVPTSLVDCEIASGLLTSHAGLTLGDLAPVVGAGLGALGLGYEQDDVTSETAENDDPVPVWQPEATEIAPVAEAHADESASSDPFTGAAVAAAGVGAAAGLDKASERPEALDDETVLRTAIAAELEAARNAPTDPVEVDELDEPTEARPATFDDPTTPLVPLADLDDATVPPDAAIAEELDEAVAPLTPVATAATAAAAAATAATADAARGAESPKSRKGLILILGLLAAAVLIGLLIWLFGGSSDSDESGSTSAVVAEPTEAPAEPTAAPEPTEAPAPTPEPAPTEEPAPEPTPEPAAEPTPEPEPEPTADPLAGLPPLSSLPERGAVFRPPILYLEGPVQTQEQADELYQRAIEVVGPDNVVNEYVIRPDAPAATDGNVRVEQAVLFQTGSSVISEQFIGTLELGVAVMALNPQVQMVVEGHTDSVGGEEANLRLSEQRAQAVVDYLVSRGVDVGRLEPVGFGESAPVASNDDAEGRQINRRIEVNLLDLLAAE